MAFRKVAHHICRRRSRGFCQNAEVVHEAGWSKELASIGEHVAGDRKALLPALQIMIKYEILAAQKETEVLQREAVAAQREIVAAQKEIVAAQKETVAAQKQIEFLTAYVSELRAQIEELKAEKIELKAEKLAQIEELKAEKIELKAEKFELKAEFRAQVEGLTADKSDLRAEKTKAELNTFKALGINNTRGLFEKLQETLAGTFLYGQGLRGTALWEAILKQNAPLGACIEKHTNVRASDVTKQAMHIYHIYTILSQHVHAGKELADLQAHKRGTILFQRGPMSPEQVSIFNCLGVEAGLDIAEDPKTRPS